MEEIERVYEELQPEKGRVGEWLFKVGAVVEHSRVGEGLRHTAAAENGQREGMQDSDAAGCVERRCNSERRCIMRGTREERGDGVRVRG